MIEAMGYEIEPEPFGYFSMLRSLTSFFVNALTYISMTNSNVNAVPNSRYLNTIYSQLIQMW